MLNEKKLTQAELDKREDIIMKMKKNKRSLVNKYGKDAEKVMYGRATNIAKKQAESMKKDRLSELIKDSLSKKGVKKEEINLKERISSIFKSIKEAGPEDVKAQQDLNKELETTKKTAADLEAASKKNPLAEDEEEIVNTKKGKFKKHDIKNLEEMDPVSWDLKNGIDAQWAPNKVGQSSDGDITDDPTDGYDSSHTNTIKETTDSEAWNKLERLRDAIQDDDYIISSIMKAMSTDDANLYLDAMIRDHIDIVDVEKNTLKEGHKKRIKDYEGKMARKQLARIAKYAQHLFHMIENETQLESWVQSKLTKASDYMCSVKHHLEGEALTSAPPVINEDEPIKDIEGKALNIGDVVRCPDNNEYQCMYSYSEKLPFLSPWDGKKPDLMNKTYFKDKPEFMKRLEKVKSFTDTKGGFIK